MDGNSRLVALERETRALRRRVYSLELELGVATAAPPPAAPPTPAPLPPPAAIRAERGGTSWEGLLRGRVLGWLRGLAVALRGGRFFSPAVLPGGGCPR